MDNNIEKILEELKQFTGTERYYRSGFGLLRLTDGAHYLRERLNCYWLIDVIESYQPELRGIDFQVWGINVHKDKSAVVHMREDDGLPNRVEQRIPYTDFPLPEYELFCIDRVVLLKSEY